MQDLPVSELLFLPLAGTVGGVDLPRLRFIVKTFKKERNGFDENLTSRPDAAADYHGHLCSGMVLGVRMSRCALRHLGIEAPYITVT